MADPDGSPATTYVSATADREVVTVCWLGDSRAYWLTEDRADCARLTRDDSLAEEVVAAGLASVEEAMASPQAHVITRWLGADHPDPQPHVAQFAPPGPGGGRPGWARAAWRADRPAGDRRRPGEVRHGHGWRRQHHRGAHPVPGRRRLANTPAQRAKRAITHGSVLAGKLLPPERSRTESSGLGLSCSRR